MLLVAFVVAHRPTGEPCLDAACPESPCLDEACRVEPRELYVTPVNVRPEPIWVGQRRDNVVPLSNVMSGKPLLCARYADVAGRVVNGWYLSERDRTHFGSPVEALGYVSFVHDSSEYRPGPVVPKREVGWDCGSSGLHLVLDLPENDDRHQDADDALADILSALPWRGLDPKADGMKIVVTLARTGDVATFDPGEG